MIANTLSKRADCEFRAANSRLRQQNTPSESEISDICRKFELNLS
ncbi:unnamed protein product, partial [Rotaria sordida]